MISSKNSELTPIVLILTAFGVGPAIVKDVQKIIDHAVEAVCKETSEARKNIDDQNERIENRGRL